MRQRESRLAPDVLEVEEDGGVGSGGRRQAPVGRRVRQVMVRLVRFEVPGLGPASAIGGCEGMGW